MSDSPHEPESVPLQRPQRPQPTPSPVAKAELPAEALDAPGLDAAQGRTVQEMVAELLSRRGYPAHFAAGDLVDIQGPADYGRPRIGLGNIARQLASAPREEWDARLTEWFDAIAEQMDPRRREDIIRKALAELPERLRVRLLPPGVEGFDPSSPTVRQDLPGLYTALVLDLGDALQTFGPRELEKSGLSADEAFAMAFKRLREGPTPPAGSTAVEGGGTLGVLQTQDAFVTSNALLMAEREDLQGSGGVAFAIPNREVLLYVPLRDGREMPAFQQLLVMARQLRAQGSYPLTETVYWWDRKRLHAIAPVPNDEGRLQVELPEGLAQWLAGGASA